MFIQCFSYLGYCRFNTGSLNPFSLFRFFPKFLFFCYLCMEKKSIFQSNALFLLYGLNLIQTQIRFQIRFHLSGVDTVKPEYGAHKLTVVGKVDPSKLREQLAGKLKKKVDLISPQPKKEKDDNSNNKQPEKAKDDKKPKEVSQISSYYWSQLTCACLIVRTVPTKPPLFYSTNLFICLRSLR